jgi:hypothetical protein
MQKKRRATVLLEKYVVWFSKMLINAFISFKDVIMAMPKKYF